MKLSTNSKYTICLDSLTHSNNLNPYIFVFCQIKEQKKEIEAGNERTAIEFSFNNWIIQDSKIHSPLFFRFSSLDALLDLKLLLPITQRYIFCFQPSFVRNQTTCSSSILPTSMAKILWSPNTTAIVSKLVVLQILYKVKAIDNKLFRCLGGSMFQ